MGFRAFVEHMRKTYGPHRGVSHEALIGSAFLAISVATLSFKMFSEPTWYRNIILAFAGVYGFFGTAAIVDEMVFNSGAITYALECPEESYKLKQTYEKSKLFPKI